MNSTKKLPFRKLYRTQLSQEKLKHEVLSLPKKNECSKQSLKNNDYEKLREKYKNTMNNNNGKGIHKCFSMCSMGNRFCHSLTKKRPQFQGDHFLSKKMRQRRYNQFDHDTHLQSRLRLQTRVLQTLSKSKSKSLKNHDYNYRVIPQSKTVSNLRRKYEVKPKVQSPYFDNNENVNTNNFQLGNESKKSSLLSQKKQKQKTKFMRNAQLKSKKLSKNYQNLQQYDDYSLKQFSKQDLPKKDKNKKKQSIIKNNGQQIEHYKQQRNEINKELMTSDYERIKILQKKAKESFVQILNKATNSMISSESYYQSQSSRIKQESVDKNDSIDNNQQSKQILPNNTHREGAPNFNKIGNNSQIIGLNSNITSFVNQEANRDSKGEQNAHLPKIAEDLYQTGQFIYNKQLSDIIEKQSPINQTKQQTKRHGIQRMNTITDYQPNNFILNRHTQNPRNQIVSQIKVPELAIDNFASNKIVHKTVNFNISQEQMQRENTRKIKSHPGKFGTMQISSGSVKEKITCREFNLAQSIKLWSSYEETKLESKGLRFQESHQKKSCNQMLDDLKGLYSNINSCMPSNTVSEQNSTISKIYEHLNRLNFITEFIIMKEEMYEGSFTKIYDMQSFLLYKRFYQQRLNMYNCMKGSSERTCFILTDIEISKNQLSESRNSQKFKDFMNSLYQCNLLIKKSLSGYCQKIKQQHPENNYASMLNLQILRPKSTGLIMTLLNEELQSLVMKREEITTKLLQSFNDSENQLKSNLDGNSLKLKHEPSIGLGIQIESDEQNQYQAVSLRAFSIMQLVFLLSELTGRKTKKIQYSIEANQFEHYFKQFYGAFKETILFYN